ncbi:MULTISPECIES: TetR/AcrR family transcriptional regulator [unclassified Aliivibrio]|uniref:TetR/AcrR family transcriptional regulator n=1 Tax=unclassified Aliivibrio TaxID=2645654 RepID=UPI00080E3CF0|nr:MULTISPECIES: TetR/AcrR family transcriptional regulator [unclassified Aliivibrio]OCH16650.1 TetR family transcriptional regulator [Aliivibrio sp. 1S165]OCH21465.1 TetR family transcriptional regulator [Aliivibrio sp. 1S128]OCH32897.1 TetR family transcriptional regulator [Aliivibrio sp. 1S175]
MAKTAKFNRDDVIEKATNLYWEKGFHATSMRNLQDVIDMRPGSIYATFGSKEGLFKEVLHKYTEMGVAQIAECRANTSSPLNALKNFITLIVLESQTSAPSGMCMLAKTIAELTEENAELLTEAKKMLVIMEGQFMTLLEEAQQQGELSKDKDVSQLARFVQVQIMGLRVYACASNGDAPLDQMIDDMFMTLKIGA